MHDIKVTVIKLTRNEELIEEYGTPSLPVCPFHKVGQEFISKAGQKPDGLCEEAWTAFGKYVFAFAHGADGFWPTWIEKRNLSINSCNDGLRPVIFKLEVIKE